MKANSQKQRCLALRNYKICTFSFHAEHSALKGCKKQAGNFTCFFGKSTRRDSPILVWWTNDRQLLSELIIALRSLSRDRRIGLNTKIHTEKANAAQLLKSKLNGCNAFTSFVPEQRMI